MPLPFQPKSSAAQNLELTAHERATVIVQALHPDAVVYQTLMNEARFPILLLLIPAADGKLEAATAFMATNLSAEAPAFHLVSGWEVA